MHLSTPSLRFSALTPKPKVIFTAQGYGDVTPEGYAAQRHGQSFVDQLKGIDLSQCPNVSIQVDTTEKGGAVDFGPDKTRVYIVQRGQKEPFAVLDPQRGDGLTRKERKGWKARLQDVPFFTPRATWGELFCGDDFRRLLSKVRDIAWLAEKEFKPTIHYAPEVEQSPGFSRTQLCVNELMDAIGGMNILKEAGGAIKINILPGEYVQDGDFVFQVDVLDRLQHSDIDSAGGSAPFRVWKFANERREQTLENFKTNGLGKTLLRLYHFGVKDLAPIPGDKIYHPRGQCPR